MKHYKIIISIACFLACACTNPQSSSIGLSDSTESTETEITLQYVNLTVTYDNHDMKLIFREPEESDGNLFYMTDEIITGNEYYVNDLDGEYTDICITSFSDHVWPYVFLLTEEGTVQCVPVGDQMLEEDFHAITIDDVHDVTQFSQPVSTDAYAIRSDGYQYDLLHAYDKTLGFVESYEPYSDTATQIMMNQQSIFDQIQDGLTIRSLDDVIALYGELCLLMETGKEENDTFTQNMLYAVGRSGSIYEYSQEENTWHGITTLSEVYELSYNDFYSLLSVATDLSDIPYASMLSSDTEVITTNGTEDTIVLVPLQSNETIEICKIEYNETTQSFEETETYATIEHTKRGETYTVQLLIPETMPTIRINVSYYDLSSQLDLTHDGKDNPGIYVLDGANG